MQKMFKRVDHSDLLKRIDEIHFNMLYILHRYRQER